MKVKEKTSKQGFDKDNVVRELDHLIAQYYQEYDELPAQILVDKLTVWTMINAGVREIYKDMPITVAGIGKTGILVTDDEGIKEIKAAIEEAHE